MCGVQVLIELWLYSQSLRGLARLDYGFTSLLVKANVLGYIGEIVEKVILLWPDFFFDEST